MSVLQVRSPLAHVAVIGTVKGRRRFVGFENEMSR